MAALYGLTSRRSGRRQPVPAVTGVRRARPLACGPHLARPFGQTLSSHSSGVGDGAPTRHDDENHYHYHANALQTMEHHLVCVRLAADGCLSKTCSAPPRLGTTTRCLWQKTRSLGSLVKPGETARALSVLMRAGWILVAGPKL